MAVISTGKHTVIMVTTTQHNPRPSHIGEEYTESVIVKRVKLIEDDENGVSRVFALDKSELVFILKQIEELEAKEEVKCADESYWA